MSSAPASRLVRHLAAMAIAALLLVPSGAMAQDATNWVLALDSPDWRVRADGIERLNRLPLADLPGSFRQKAIALLERDGTTSPGSEVGEGYGEYVISLVEGVLRLNDPAAVRGMALVGINTSRAAQEFLAAQGGTAVAPLDEAWQDENSREAVGETWALMLVNFADRLTSNQRLQVIRRILSARGVDAQAFTNATDDAGLVSAIGVVEDVASTDVSSIVRTVAAGVATRLRDQRSGLTSSAQLDRLADGLNALCLGAVGPRATACAALSTSLADAQTRLDANQESAARDALVAFTAQVDTGFQQGIWTADEQRILGASSRYTASRLIATIYLHGTGGTANPPTLSLSGSAPTATDASYKDSPSIAFSGGNTWKDVGTWQAAPAVSNGTLSTLGETHVWLGLKNSDDQGTNFDVRVELAKNGNIIASGQTLCVQGVTRNPTNAKEVAIPVGAFPATAFNGTTDVLTLKVSTRIGTAGTGASCGGHSNAVGLRLYFDATSRTARFDAKF
jgi:hypothetical protein